MPWNLIYLSTADNITSFAQTPIQWNFLPLIPRAIDIYSEKYSSGGKRMCLAMGMETFRNFPCTRRFPMYVFSSCPKFSDDSHVIFVASMYDIPKNDFVVVWFLGSDMILRCFSEFLSEAIHIRICVDSLQLWPNLLDQSKFSKFTLPAHFSKGDIFFKDNTFLEFMGKKIFTSMARHTIQKEPEANKTSQCGDHTPCLYDNPILCMRSCSPHTLVIHCAEGFPVFPFNLTYQSDIIQDTFAFLNGYAEITLFCRHFDLVRAIDSSSCCDLEPHTIATLNAQAVRSGLMDVLESICMDSNFMVTTNGQVLLSFVPRMQHAVCAPLSLKLVFQPRCSHVAVDMVVWLSECNMVDNCPYVVVSSTALLLAMCHYLSNNCRYPLAFRAECVTIQIGRLFYFYSQEIFMRSYRMCPVLLPPFVKPLTAYNSADFEIMLS